MYPLAHGEMATSALTRTISTSGSTEHSNFLSHLQNSFTDEEASTFLNSFAMFLHEKYEEFCIDLDNAWRWLGHSKKQSSVDLVQKILRPHHDFVFTASRERNKPDKYILKPDAFKKLLLAARTETSKKAADYFIKIERAIQEFYTSGGQAFSSSEPRNYKWKTLALEHYTEELCNPPDISSAGYNDDLSDPQLYLAIPKNVKFPPGYIPEGTAVVEFGWTSSSGKRFEAHRKSHGEFIATDHFPCPDAPGLEHELKRQLTVLDLLVYGKRQDGSKNTELFKVRSQAEYLSIVARIYEIQQRIISSVCDVQRQKEKRLTAEAEKASDEYKLAQEKEKTLQEKEKSRQSDNDTRARIAEAETRKAEVELKRFELSLQLGQIPSRPAEEIIECGDGPFQDARYESSHAENNIEDSSVSIITSSELQFDVPIGSFLPPGCNDPREVAIDDSGHAESDTDDEDGSVSTSQDAPRELRLDVPSASLPPPSNYGEEGRMAVKMIRAQLVESYLIEQLVAGILPAKIPLQTFVNRFNDWLAPPKPAPRRYHCQFSDKMFLKPMKAYENFGITKKKAQRRRQYFIDHVKFRAKLVADGKISQPLECNDASIISDNIANIDVKDGSYANELAARKEKTRKEREKRAKIVDEWLIYQLRVQKLPSEILNSQMLLLFNKWLDLENTNPQRRRYHRTFSRKMLPEPLLAYEQHGFARKNAVGGLQFYIDYDKLRAKFIADGKI